MPGKGPHRRSRERATKIGKISSLKPVNEREAKAVPEGFGAAQLWLHPTDFNNLVGKLGRKKAAEFSRSLGGFALHELIGSFGVDAIAKNADFILAWDKAKRRQKSILSVAEVAQALEARGFQKRR